MSITSGYTKYKRYAKLSDGTYKLISQWTNANTVHFDDGSTVQANLGAIKGITSDLACEDTNVAASMPAVSAKITELNNNLTNKTTYGSQTRFFGVSIGAESTSPYAYIYSENDNINFRYVDASGNISYASLRSLAKAELSGTTLYITI